ncbi:hypothetical protein [Pseudomethylobacillus aquaticus]|uniref:hypothetical protein n=1 Tax=Pseudomethylobacillus aquaticus TaxID=2676064 RepID=UPI0012D75204|nr:hypothetical protein [Pseudomethylobacillus aquaticus]
MNPADSQQHDLQRSGNPYDSLPEPIKAIYTLKEWLWLSDREKATLIESECAPDVIE